MTPGSGMDEIHLLIFVCMSATALTDTTWMSRCFDLARRGIGRVSPNPPVGALLVYQDRILGEGYHQYYGGPHAEVNALFAVSDQDRHLIPDSTLYVSLEPCCITGKTPPCTDLILKEGIRDVRVSTTDPNPLVAGQGLNHLRNHGVRITGGILEEEGKSLIRPFATNILHQRPYVLLKWAQSRWCYAGIAEEQVWLSDPITKTWSHSQRAQADAILVGARTVSTDDPALTVREFPGRSPARVIFDPNGRLGPGCRVFTDDGCPIYYFAFKTNPDLQLQHITSIVINPEQDAFSQMLQTLFNHQVGILLAEGGPYLQKSIIKQGLWDEAWVVQTQHPLDHGITAPEVTGIKIETFTTGNDRIVGILNASRPKIV